MPEIAQMPNTNGQNLVYTPTSAIYVPVSLKQVGHSKVTYELTGKSETNSEKVAAIWELANANVVRPNIKLAGQAVRED